MNRHTSPAGREGERQRGSGTWPGEDVCEKTLINWQNIYACSTAQRKQWSTVTAPGLGYHQLQDCAQLSLRSTVAVCGGDGACRKTDKSGNLGLRTLIARTWDRAKEKERDGEKKRLPAQALWDGWA
ncbi:unnamed protein product [Leuciscus chuanchicus]